MSRSLALVWAAAGLLVGLAAGWFFGRTARPDAVREDTPQVVEQASDDDAGPETDLAAPRRAGDREPPADGGRVPADTNEGALGPTSDDELFSPALLAHADANIRKGWGAIRTDEPTDDEVAEGLDTFRESTLAMPEGIGAQLARRRTEEERALEDARRGGVMDILGRLENGDSSGPFFELVEDRVTYDRLFESEHTGPAIDGVTALGSDALRKGEPVADGSTLTFPAGVFQLEDFGTYWRARFPRDLTIRGAGKGGTLLVLKQDLSAYDVVHNLTIERCTVHADDNYMFDVREPSMSLTLRDVRITGWDMGAGSSCLFGTEGLALRATDCDFLGGYGRSPSSGQLFDIRHDGLIARFERCVIERTDPFRNVGSGVTVVFAGCELHDVWSYPREVPGAFRLDGSSLQWLDGQQHSAELSRDLNDLFPGWKDALRR